MEITFYNKNTSKQEVTARKQSFPKPKRSKNFPDFKGLTLREYFVLTVKQTQMHSDGSVEKQTASFEETPKRKQEDYTIKKNENFTQHQKGLKFKTEASEEQIGWHGGKHLKQMLRLRRKGEKKDGLNKIFVPQSLMPTSRDESSQLSIKNSLKIFSKQKNANLHNVKPTPHESASFSFVQPLNIPHLSQSPYKIRQIKQGFESNKPKRKVFSYYYPQLHGSVKGKQAKFKEILDKIGSTPDLKNSFLEHPKSTTRK